MRNYHRWTDSEDRILLNYIKKNLQNREEAFRLAAKKLNISQAACHMRWYSILSNPKHKKYVGCKFTLLSRYERIDNRTRKSKLAKSTPINKSLWSKIKELLGF